MKRALIILAVLLAEPAVAAPAQTILRCPNHTLVIVERSRIKAVGEISSFGWVARSRDGDCRGRATACYQEGQWMANVSGRSLWINTDTDDVPGRGVQMRCAVIG